MKKEIWKIIQIIYAYQKFLSSTLQYMYHIFLTIDLHNNVNQYEHTKKNIELMGV